MKFKLFTLRRFTTLAATLTVLACVTLTARADDKGKAGQFSHGDFKFVSEAASGSLKEVALGRLAEKKASDPAVRDYAERMMADHQKTYDELKDLASERGATLPTEDPDTVARWKDKIDDENGADFDKAYMKLMVSDHKKDVRDFQKQSESADDASLKAWAAKTLPTLREHLKMATTIEDRLTGAQTRAANK